MMIVIVWMQMFKILFNFYQHWHTHHGDGYDHDGDLDDADCFD